MFASPSAPQTAAKSLSGKKVCGTMRLNTNSQIGCCPSLTALSNYKMQFNGYAPKMKLKGTTQYEEYLFDYTYGSVSAGRGKQLFRVLFFLKVEPPREQT